MISDARTASVSARNKVISGGLKRMPPLNEQFESVAGRQGHFEAWRLRSLKLVSNMILERHAYHDWLTPFIKFDGLLIYRAQWEEFWLHSADKSALPRQWLRWAFSFAQRFRKITSGTSCDEQLSMYFLETDMVVTADKALLDVLEECRPYAPCRLPDAQLISAGARGVEHLLQMLH